jgi:type VI secretion system secreted protein Hcp
MAVDYFLKIDAIDGESQDANYKNQIQLHSFSWGGAQHSTVAGTGGSGAGKVSLSDFSIMKTLDKASPKLFQAMTKGTHVATAQLTACKSAGASGGKPFLTLKFKELFVTSQQLSGASEVPSESVTFTYNEITMEYFVQDEKGNLTSTGAITYNTKTNASS